MNETGRRRVRRRTAREGEPNVLSNAAVPNTLSGMAGPPAQIPTGAQLPTGTRGASPGRLTTGTTDPRPRVRIPSFATVIFLLFLVITVLRLLNDFVR